jgi:hypothetical protein
VSALLALVLTLAATPAAGAAPPATSCVGCHLDADFFGDDATALANAFAGDVHAQAGLACHDCHGGNPDPALAGDPEAAMDPSFRDPYRGAPARQAVPAFCGRCHSDPEFMKRFRTDIRVDQEREYATSHHGRALAAGDERVATCVDCHGVHDILAPSDPRAPVYPTRVAATCGGCHSDATRMRGYRLADGRPLPTDQYARWRQSVHASALLEREDLSAPTCNDCHGNHGAAPPGLDSVAFVCGSCHGREAELFRSSPKRAGFEEHNALLAESGGEGCAACHAPPEPRAAVAIHSFSECATCHDNHAIVRPTLAMLGFLPPTPCALCHEGAGPLAAEVPEPPAKAERFVAMRDALLAQAQVLGVAGQERFDWLVDRALDLETHTIETPAGERVQRPEFARLFEKFRIGKSAYAYRDPETREEHRVRVVRCSDCHAPDEAAGEVGVAFVGGMRELIGMTARAERILLQARRGGVETRDALLAIDRAVDAQIELEALVHSFDAGGAFAAKRQEGLTHAQSALAAGQGSLRELVYRRRGLGVALGCVALVLVALALKIRQVSRPE